MQIDSSFSRQVWSSMSLHDACKHRKVNTLTFFLSLSQTVACLYEKWKIIQALNSTPQF